MKHRLVPAENSFAVRTAKRRSYRRGGPGSSPGGLTQISCLHAKTSCVRHQAREVRASLVKREVVQLVETGPDIPSPECRFESCLPCDGLLPGHRVRLPEPQTGASLRSDQPLALGVKVPTMLQWRAQSGVSQSRATMAGTESLKTDCEQFHLLSPPHEVVA